MNIAISELDFPHEFLERYRIVSYIGQGGEGLVLRVTATLGDSRDFAAKIVARSEDDREPFKEVTVMRKLQAAGVMGVSQSVEWFCSDKWHVVLTEIGGDRWYLEPLGLKRMPGGFPCKALARFFLSIPREPSRDLFAYISRVTGQTGMGLDSEIAKKVFRNILRIHLSLFDLGLLHGDIKTENYLLDKDQTVTLIDFSNTSHLGQLGQRCTGTLGYLSPQMAAKKSRFDGSDEVWSLGVLLFEMLVGYQPSFTTVNELDQLSRTSLGTLEDPAAGLLVGRALDPVRQTRIRMQEMLEHEWLQK